MTDHPHGTVDREQDGYVVRFERRLRHPRARVWRANTESEHLAHWLPCDIIGERRAGARVELPFWPAVVERHQIETPTLPGEILVWDPPAVFEWTWSTDRLRWELHDDGEGTLLRFATWLGADSPDAASTAAGYHVCLDQLVELLDTGTTARSLVDAEPAALEEHYRSVIASAG
jgi:uncharacterized protein YndB with AHSA1/START domain